MKRHVRDILTLSSIHRTILDYRTERFPNRISQNTRCHTPAYEQRIRDFSHWVLEWPGSVIFVREKEREPRWIFVLCDFLLNKGRNAFSS